MRKSFLICAVFILALSHSVGRADFDDLPDPGGDGTITPTPPPAPGEQPGSGQSQYAGSITIGGVSRQTGGTVYSIRLYKTLPLLRLDLRVNSNKAKFHSVTLVAESGERVDVSYLRDTAVMEAGSLVSSEALDNSKKIASLEVVAESFGTEADIMVTAVSNVELPKLLLKVEPPKPAPTPLPEPTPGPQPTPTPLPTQPNDGGPIAIGDTVLVNSNSVGMVAQILAGSKLVITNSKGERTTVEMIFVEKSAKCVDVYCQGQKVQYNGVNAQIINLFPSGWVYLSLPGGSRKVVDMFFISEGANCDSRNEYCVGDSVLYQNRQEGTVTGIRGDEAISVRVLATGEVVTAKRKELAASLRCTSGDFQLCVGERVLVQNIGAEILGLYSNGFAKVRMDRPNKIMFLAQKALTKKITCMRNICVGQKARYGNQQATVKEIFSNGTARVVIGIVGREYLVRLDSLSPW